MPQILTDEIYSIIRPVLYGYGFRFDGKVWKYVPQNPKEIVTITLKPNEWIITEACDNGYLGIGEDEWEGKYHDRGIGELYQLAKILGK